MASGTITKGAGCSGVGATARGPQSWRASPRVRFVLVCKPVNSDDIPGDCGTRPVWHPACTAPPIVSADSIADHSGGRRADVGAREPARPAGTRAVPRSERAVDDRWLLLIDDDSSVRSLVSEMLTILGYRVDQACDGVEGLGLFDRGHYDLVVTDYMMPRLNGAAVADAIRRKRSTAGVMVLTGCADDSGVECLRHQGIPIVRKPVGLIQLKAAVEAALR